MVRLTLWPVADRMDIPCAVPTLPRITGAEPFVLMFAVYVLFGTDPHAQLSATAQLFGSPGAPPDQLQDAPIVLLQSVSSINKHIIYLHQYICGPSLIIVIHP
jgi:hypothetical protein